MAYKLHLNKAAKHFTLGGHSSATRGFLDLSTAASWADRQPHAVLEAILCTVGVSSVPLYAGSGAPLTTQL